MSTTCENLFDDPPSSVRKVFTHIFTIVREHWKPLILILLLQLVSLIGVSIVLCIFSAAVFAAMFVDFVSVTSDMRTSDMGNGRHLVNYMVGSGATRALDYTYDDGNDTQNQMSDFDFEAFFDIMIKYSGQIVVFVIIIIVVLSLVMSTFIGAMAHTAAEAYCGDTPEACKSIRVGWCHKWQIYIYQILILFVLFGVFLCAIFGGVASKNGAISFLVILVVFAFVIFFATVMVAAIPAIIVEGKSSTGAIRRSYDLCKGEFCFIFCNNFCLQCSALVLMIIADEILGIFPDVIAGLVHLGVTILLSITSSMLPFAIYISIRMRNENYTRDDLNRELMGDTQVVKATEFSAIERKEIV